jgi:hypothetical protein
MDALQSDPIEYDQRRDQWSEAIPVTILEIARRRIPAPSSHRCSTTTLRGSSLTEYGRHLRPALTEHFVDDLHVTLDVVRGGVKHGGSVRRLREDLVVRRQALTDAVLNRAVLVARTTSGPMGVYAVSVGYEVAAPGGAAAGWLAMAMPALLLVIPLYGASAIAMRHPRVRNAIAGLVLASAALSIMTAGPLLRDVVDRVLGG